jgi:hypothetical protein
VGSTPTKGLPLGVGLKAPVLEAAKVTRQDPALEGWQRWMIVLAR